MLEDPRAHQALDEFVSQWLRFDRILTSSRDRRRYPQFTRETAIAMTEEARQFIADLVWNDRNFMDAFTANYGFVNADLARIYGVPAPAREFERVSFPAGIRTRRACLGKRLFLSLSAKPDDTSLTGRGLFVREQFLCQHVPPPPAGVNTNLPPSTEAHPQTNRERMAEHVDEQVLRDLPQPDRSHRLRASRSSMPSARGARSTSCSFAAYARRRQAQQPKER